MLGTKLTNGECALQNCQNLGIAIVYESFEDVASDLSVKEAALHHRAARGPVSDSPCGVVVPGMGFHSPGNRIMHMPVQILNHSYI